MDRLGSKPILSISGNLMEMGTGSETWCVETYQKKTQITCMTLTSEEKASDSDTRLLVPSDVESPRLEASLSCNQA